MGHAKAFVKGFPYLEQRFAQRFVDKNFDGIADQGVAEGSKVKTAKGHGDVVQGTDVKTIAKADLGKNKLNLPKGYGDVVQPQKLKSVAKAKGVAEAGSNAMADTAKRLANKDDGKVAKLRAAGDKRRDAELKGRDIAKRNESVDLKQENAWDRLQREKALESAGVGIITKQNTTVDVNKNTPKKNLKAFKLI
jgi:hypothetical protein